MTINIQNIQYELNKHPTHTGSTVLTVKCNIDGKDVSQSIAILNAAVSDLSDDPSYITNIMNDIIKKLYSDMLFDRFFAEHQGFKKTINTQDIIETIKNNNA